MASVVNRKNCLSSTPHVYCGNLKRRRAREWIPRRIDENGSFEEPLLIGVTKDHVLVVRRVRDRHFLPLEYRLVPSAWCRLRASCVHRREVEILVTSSTESAILWAALANCGRSAVEMNATWRQWEELRTDFDENSKRKKQKIKKGTYNPKKSLRDYFQDQNFVNRSEFLVDESYFNFWQEKNEQTSKGDTSATQTDAENLPEESTGCCDWLIK